MAKYYFRTSILFLFLLISFPSFSETVYTVGTVPNDHLKDASDYISNPDGIISPQAENQINNEIALTATATSAEIAVVLLSSIGYEDIDNFATALFTNWGIGKKNDNGLLFLLVYDQSQMVFRTGYGLEGVLPDIILSRIIRNDIAPRLRERDFDAGIIAGITKTCEYLKNPDTVAEILQREKNQAAAESSAFMKKLLKGYLIISILIFSAFVIFYISKVRSNQPNNLKYGELDQSKGAVILFTIIFPLLMIFFVIFYFWAMKRLRNTPPHCPECRSKMRKLSEAEEDEYLTPTQIEEENIKSVDYDVWICPDGQHNEKVIYPYNNRHSKYMVCPHCHAKTYFLQNDVVKVAATSISKGKGERMYFCLNCRRRDIVPYIIPMIVVISDSGNGGFGGSSSGSSGGSWGGGRTGGGGARGGW